MIPPLDLSKLPAQAQKILDEGANPKLRLAAARGIVPGLRPADIVTVLVALSSATDPPIAEAARQSFAKLPPPILSGALVAELQAPVVDALARAHLAEPDIVAKLVMIPDIDRETIEWLAQHGSEAVTEILAVNQERLLRHPRLMELLYLNPETRMSTADRIVEFAVRSGVELHGIPAWKEAARAIEGELIVAEPLAEPLPEDLEYRALESLARKVADDHFVDAYREQPDGTEALDERYLSLHQRIAEMSVSQKIRRALLGTKEERALLVRDQNRLVAASAVRSPRLQEPDVVQISRNRNVSDEVLRIIGTSPEWMKSYQIKRNLVENPRTPMMVTQRLVVQLREADLQKLAKDKNVPSPVRNAARRHLTRRS